MDYQDALAVSGLVNGVGDHHYTAEVTTRIAPEDLVVVPRHVDDLGPFARLAQDLLDDVVVALRPVPGLAQPPAIEDVPDQVEVVGLRAANKVE